jgi:hypothetical protein
MAETPKFKKWSLKESDLQDVTPFKVRDLIIECFYEAQKETFRRIKMRTGKFELEPATDEDLRRSIVNAIKMAFNKTNGDFEQPAKDNLLLVVAYLARQATGWGTPPDIIEHHKNEIYRAIDLLP